MCLLLFSFQPHGPTPLVLGANRDEFFTRPTAAADFWQDQPQLVAGRDLQGQGTWLGLTTSGRFAAVTNVREPGVRVDNPLSRGELTRDYLTANHRPHAYLQAVQQRMDRYAGFNLLVGQLGRQHSSLYYLSNRHAEIHTLQAGLYGLSNHLLDSPWPKVVDGKLALANVLKAQGNDHRAIRTLLENTTPADDARLPDTGVSYAREKALSSRFIKLGDYGTRASTVVTIERGQVDFSEQSYDQQHSEPRRSPAAVKHYRFRLD
ncbi:MAG: NRDE family protein [Cellvibrionaceae bacterium]|nr:NRDE family protein [Cellvibrionaceae bacterium]